MHMLNSWVGYSVLIFSLISYILVFFEEKIHLKRTKIIWIANILMWVLIGIYEMKHGGKHLEAHKSFKLLAVEIGGLFLFLLVVMTYINALTSLNVFQALRAWLLSKKLSFRSLFWITGILTYFLSALADNLTSALLMTAIAFVVSNGNKRFIVPVFVNIVVAANAGGVWSPFGDITSLMVWTSGNVETLKFVYLLLPSIVSWLIPALIMSFFLPSEKPVSRMETIALKRGARRTVLCFILTIATGVSFHHILHLPAFIGMMCGFVYLVFVSFCMTRWSNKKLLERLGFIMLTSLFITRWGEEKVLKKLGLKTERRKDVRVDVVNQLEQVEFDALFFIVGVLTTVSALQYIGFLKITGGGLYNWMGFTAANIAIGAISAIVDNIPVMYAVLNVDLKMGLDQWLLVTLTTGIGGSLLPIGSVAGVAVMSIYRKDYTFMSHLRWSPVIALGYLGSIGVWWLVSMWLRNSF
ncbi:MAG: sodium:proton antiporter [Candidatus Scalindua sp.]|nr:sodium:proton antiporter [Candidatus Scalindua sp.]